MRTKSTVGLATSFLALLLVLGCKTQQAATAAADREAAAGSAASIYSLDITFQPKAENPEINGIEILPAL